MKYTFEFKLDCVLKYKNGEHIDTSGLAVNRSAFMGQVYRWVRAYDDMGPEALRHREKNRRWTAEERLGLVLEVLAGHPITSVARKARVERSVILGWIRKFEENGPSGLEFKRGRPPRRPDMTKTKPKKEKQLSLSEREELELLRKKTLYLEMENEYLKKLDALVSKREAAEAKAKKRKR